MRRFLAALAARLFRAKPSPRVTSAQQAAFEAAFAANFERWRPDLLAKTEEPSLDKDKAAVYTLRLRGLGLATMLLVPSLALADGPVEHVPFMFDARWVPGMEAAARLNQDGSWSIGGDVNRMPAGFGAEFECLTAAFRRYPVASNPSPDNSLPISETRSRQIACADPIVHSCRRELNLTCEMVISQR